LRIAAEGRVSLHVEWTGSLWIFYRYFWTASECGLLLLQFFLCSLHFSFNSAVARSINVFVCVCVCVWGGGDLLSWSVLQRITGSIFRTHPNRLWIHSDHYMRGVNEVSLLYLRLHRVCIFTGWSLV
jgi:hypothetical protein